MPAQLAFPTPSPTLRGRPSGPNCGPSAPVRVEGEVGDRNAVAEDLLRAVATPRTVTLLSCRLAPSLLMCQLAYKGVLAGAER